MRPKIVAANWKMHTTLAEGLQVATELVGTLQKLPTPAVEVVLMPPYTHLATLHKLHPTLQLGAQNCHECPTGAFTGEISAPMLQSIGVRFVLLGHSERKESPRVVAQKVTTALTYALRPIVCCGETQTAYQAGTSVAVVEQQLRERIFHLSPTEMEQVVIAYEPVWAIGTGSTPTVWQIQAMHTAIRCMLTTQYGGDLAARIPILYGGSCHAENAAGIAACTAVDGGLIGQASLQAAAFDCIVRAFQSFVYGSIDPHATGS